MRFTTSLLLPFLLFIACQSNPPSKQIEQVAPEQSAQATIHEIPELKAFLDSLDIQGAALVYDLQTNSYTGYNPERWQQGYLPASTFKIANSLIALETGVVTGPEMIFPWDGKPRRLKIWDKDMPFKEAFHISCVPCYQQIAREIGPERMQDYLAAFDYGKMDVREENIDLFWLTGKSRITQLEQIEFLQKIYDESLPLSPKTLTTFKELMIREETETYRLSGKTGWALRDNESIGWYVGYIEKGENVYFFATNIEPNDLDQQEGFAKSRVLVTEELFRRMKLLGF